MKTTIEIPDALFRKAKSAAAEQGVSLKVLLTDALREHIERGAGDAEKNKSAPPSPAWMVAFGGLRHLRKETKKINRTLDREFEQIERDEWQ